MFVSCECCLLSSRGLCEGSDPSFRVGGHTECVSPVECVIR